MCTCVVLTRAEADVVCGQLMPRNRIAWSCWNFLTSSVVQADGTKKANGDVVSLYVYHSSYINHR